MSKHFKEAERGVGKGLSSHPFLKSMATLITGSAVAQLITIAVSPITTRLFTPEELGVYTLVVSSVSMFGSVLSLRYDMAIVYEEDEHRVFPLITLSVMLDLCLSALVAVGFYFYFEYFSGSGYPAWAAALFTFVQCFLFGLVNVLNSYNNRRQQYAVMSSANVRRTLAQNVGIVASGLAGLGATGLIATQSVGYLFGLRAQARGLAEEGGRLKEVGRDDVAEVARRHRNQALWSAPATFANGFAYSVINYFIEFLYSSTVVGYYSISYRMLGLPTSVIAQNISRVFAERAAHDRQTTGNFRAIYKKTLLFMLAMAVPIGVILIAWSPQIFEFVFGEGWYVAGTYVQILTPMFMLRFVAGGLNSSAMIAGKQHWDFVAQAMLVVAVIASFCVSLGCGFAIEEMLSLVNLTASHIYVFYIAIFWHCAKC